MRYNNGPAFYHPVTNRLVARDSWYEGAAHIAGEEPESVEETEQAVSDVLSEGGEQTSNDVFACEFCGKEYQTENGLSKHVDKCPKKPSDEPTSNDAEGQKSASSEVTDDANVSQ